MKNIQDRNEYIEAIRSEARQYTIEKKLEAYDYFSRHGKASDLLFLTEFLYSNKPILRQNAAETVIQIFRRIKSREELADTLRYLSIYTDSLEAFRQFPPDIYLELLFVASFNGDGYVREKAVTLMRGTNRPEAFRYYLYRAADWVMPVRQAAIDAIFTLLLPVYRGIFIGLLPEVEWLLEVKRADLSGLHTEITDFLAAGEVVEFPKVSEKPRLLLYRLYLKKTGLTPTMYDLLLRDKSFLIRVELFKHFQTLPMERQRVLLLTLLRDRSAKIRLHALYAIKPFRESCKPEIITLLSDPSASMREWARLYLKAENIDPAGFYRNKIQTGDTSPGNIMGLSETGSLADLPVFEKYIQSASYQVQLTCLIAISRLDGDLAVKHALERLTSPSNRIAIKCIEILAKNPDPLILEQIRELYRAGNLRQKKLILALYNRIGGWKVIADIMLALIDPSKEIVHIAWSYLQKWRDKAVRYFTSPSSLEHARAHEAYEWVNNAHPDMDYGKEKLWQELPFFLRN